MRLPDPYARPGATLRDLLAAAAANERKGISLYDRRGKNVDRKSWSEVVAFAARWASWASARGVRAGDHVMVSLPTSFEFAAAWFGAALLGAKPLALALPRALGGEAAFRRRIDGLWKFLEPAWLVGEEWVLELARGSDAAAPYAGRIFAFPDLPPEAQAAPPGVWAEPEADEVAFLQLTSGSTSFPKAVRIAHRAILANCRGIGESGGGLFEGDVVVCWLPLNHDMGLVGLFLLALYWGLDLVLLRPETFLAMPVRWLDAFTRFRGSITAAPDFAYRYAVEKVAPEERAGLDLSSWRVACTGAETVWESTLDRFVEAYAPFGFRRGSLIPCYGLAEGTLAVTFQEAGRGPVIREFGPGAFSVAQDAARGRRVVSVGRPLLGMRVEVRGPDGRPLGEGLEGEVAFAGPCVFSGYHGDPAETTRVMDGEWLLSGDLGVLVEGELHITGRLKEILKVGGQSIGAHEIEYVGQEVIRYADGKSCAFGIVRDGRELPVLVCEVPAGDPDRLSEWASSIRRDVARAFGTQLADLVFVKRGAIPKTTSGKVRRNEVRDLYRDGKLETVGPPRVLRSGT
ncbi:MAG: AMP-binding protein [Planctomycetes bacterium]|nr:AMP-binding protein [Planctomycetota bacterium]